MEVDVLNLLILSLIKVWILLSVAILLSSRSRSTSASGLHALLFLVLLGAALIPVLVDHIPGIYLLALPEDLRVNFYWSLGIDLPSKVFTLLGSAYLLIIVFLWLKRLRQIRSVHKIVRDADNIVVTAHLKQLNDLCAHLVIKSEIDSRYSKKITTPLTIGDVHCWILLPQESLSWSEHKLRRILLHELAHIARRDWFVKQFSYFIGAIFWLVPPVWSVMNKLEWLAELSCDDIVIGNDGRRSDYASDLLEVTASRTFAGAIGLTEHRSHYERIAAVLDGARIRQNNPIKFLLHALIFLVLLLMLAGLQLGHVKRLANTGLYHLQPLVLMEIGEKPTELGEPNHPKIVHPSIFAATENPPHFPFMEPTEPVTTLEVVRTIDDVWSGAPADVIQPLVKVIPEYPHKALRRGREGVVEIAFSILPTGETTEIHVLRAQPAGVFEKAAIDAVKQYRYAPQLREIRGLNEVFEFKLLEDAP